MKYTFVITGLFLTAVFTFITWAGVPVVQAHEYELIMPDTVIGPGHWLVLDRYFANTGAATLQVNEFVALEIQGMFWFWDDWTEDVDYVPATFPGNTSDWLNIFEFNWPAGVGSLSGIRFWGALLKSDTSELIDYTFVEWAFNETSTEFRFGTTRFAENESIPTIYTCDGEDISPPLWWSNPPEGTSSFALIMDDPDAPGGTWVHWVMYDIPTETLRCREGVPADPELPDGSRQGTNSWGNIGYGGPCPPSGTHHYQFKLYALDKMLNGPYGWSKDELLKAMEGHILSTLQLTGVYSRN